MLVTKLNPVSSTCRHCIDTQMMYEQVEDCNECTLRNKECQIISTGSNFWSGDYAIILIDGKFEKVSQSRLYDIREE